MINSYHETGITNDERDYIFILSDTIGASAHWHEEIEILYVLEGVMILGINNQVYRLEKGDIIFINSNEVHYVFEKRELNYSCLIQLKCVYKEFDYNNLIGKKFKNPLLTKEQIKLYENTKYLLDVIINEYQQKQLGYKLVMKARILDLLNIIIRDVPKEDSVLYIEKNFYKKESIFNYIQNHYIENIDLSKVAKNFGYNTTYFARLFKKMTGVTFNWYLTNLRINTAKRIIISNKYDSITEVAFESGFQSIQTFNRVFKNIVGVSPLKYKKLNKEKNPK